MNIALFEVQDWEREGLSKAFPQAKIFEETLNEKNIHEVADAELISGFIATRVGKKELSQLPHLKYVITRSTGYDHIDIAACRDRDVNVCNVPSYGTHTVAEHTFALILTLTRRMHNSINHARALNFNHSEICGVDLHGKTIGIVGYGKIGEAVARIAQGFGMKIIAFSRHTPDNADANINFTSDLKELCRNSDVVSLHLPYNKHTHHIINREMIESMKKGSYLINTARGGLIDTEAILWGIDQNILAGVGLDVFEQEEILTEEVNILSRAYQQDSNIKTVLLDHILLEHPKVIVTPHNAFNSREALDNILTTTIKNIQSCVLAAPVNTVKVD